MQRAQAAVDATDAADKPRVDAGFDATRQRYTEHGLIPPPLAGTTQTTSTLKNGCPDPTKTSVADADPNREGGQVGKTNSCVATSSLSVPRKWW